MSTKTYVVALPPIFVCERCWDRVRNGSGYLAVNLESASQCVGGSKANWRVVHGDCDSGAKASDHRIYIRRFTSTNDLFLEMTNLSTRMKWFRQTNWEGMVRRVIADTERYAQTKCVKRINKNDNLEQRDARRQKYLEEMQANPDDHRHGTPYGYNNVGCRCNRCRDANNVDQRNRRAAKFITELEKQAQ